MAVINLSEKKLARNSYVLAQTITTGAGTTALTDMAALADGVDLIRNMGGSTSEGSTYSGDDYSTGDTLTVKFDRDDNIAFMVSWVSSQTTQFPKLRVQPGDAWKRDQGSFDLHLSDETTSSTGTTGMIGKRYFVGPFDGARFAQNATSTDPGVDIGQNYVEFSLVNTTSTVKDGIVHIVAFRWPDVSYAT